MFLDGLERCVCILMAGPAVASGQISSCPASSKVERDSALLVGSRLGSRCHVLHVPRCAVPSITELGSFGGCTS